MHSQAVGEFDGTSRPQIMVGETNIGGFGFGVNPSPHIYIYRLLGAASDPASWERTLVDDTGTHEARAIDLDGDGLPDLVGDEENTDLLNPPRNGRVSWWQNVTAASGTVTSNTTVARAHDHHDRRDDEHDAPDRAAARPERRRRYVSHRPGEQ